MHLGQPLQNLRKLLESFFRPCFYAAHQQSYAISSALGSSSFNSYSDVTLKNPMYLYALPFHTGMNLTLLNSPVIYNGFIVNSRLDSKPTKVPGNTPIKNITSFH